MNRSPRRIANPAFAVALLLVSSIAPAHSQSKGMCLQFFDQQSGIHTRVECLEALFSEPKWHFTLSSLPPGNGPALGGMFESEDDYKTASGKLWSAGFKAEAIGSANRSWAAIGAADIVPPLYKPDHDNAGNTCQRLGKFCTQTQLSLHFLATRRTLQTISFYGLGPSSPATKHTFVENDTFGTASAQLPLTNYLVAEGGVEVRGVGLPPTSDPLSVNNNFTNTTAPGLLSQPDFVHSHVAVLTTASALSNPVTNDSPLNHKGPLMKRHLQFTFANSGEYQWYAATNGSSDSFEQLVATGDETLDLGSNVRHFVQVGDIGKNLARRLFFYMLQGACGDGHKLLTDPKAYVLKVTQQCDYGKIELRSQLKSSFAGDGSVIPFYLEPTLGGSDIDSEVSLRGFPDYRFRDRDSFFLQSDYSVPVYDPVGLLLFYEAGNVGPNVSSLSFRHFRQDAGLGATFSVLHNVIAQIYMAWGAGHGPALNYNFSKLF
jgi:hypothetical protein